MATNQSDEVRCRVTIDRDMGELFDRLANAKRQPREIVHLLRLGLMYENILSGKVVAAGAGVVAAAASAAATSDGGVLSSGGSSARRTTASGKGKDSESETRREQASSASVDSFVEATGLDASFFATKPPAFSM